MPRTARRRAFEQLKFSEKVTKSEDANMRLLADSLAMAVLYARKGEVRQMIACLDNATLFGKYIDYVKIMKDEPWSEV